MTVSIMSTAEAVAGLRAAADWLETNSEQIGKQWWFAGLEAFNLTAEQIATVAASEGTWRKDVTDSTFSLTRTVGPFEISVHADREAVCVARPTGRKKAVRQIATPAVYQTVEVDEIEWECLPVLAHQADS